jgi:hypothetical protein
MEALSRSTVIPQSNYSFSKNTDVIMYIEKLSISEEYHEDNTVTLTYNETSTQAGNLDASSTLHLYGNNYTVYNLNIVNSYGAGTQVSLNLLG